MSRNKNSDELLSRVKKVEWEKLSGKSVVLHCIKTGEQGELLVGVDISNDLYILNQKTHHSKKQFK